MPGIERPKSLMETVLAHLREQIIQGDLELGSALPERQLAEKLMVSKTPVREALAQLRSEGLVRILPQRGAYVFTLSSREVVEICEFRLAVESSALAFAIERNRVPLTEDLGRIVEQMALAQASGDMRAYLRLDTAFHATFFTHCRNQYLRDSYERYVGKIAALRTHLATKPLHTKLSFQEHKRILSVVRSGTVTAALEILKAHIGRTRETYSEEVEDIAAADSLSEAV